MILFTFKSGSLKIFAAFSASCSAANRLSGLEELCDLLFRYSPKPFINTSGVRKCFACLMTEPALSYEMESKIEFICAGEYTDVVIEWVVFEASAARAF